MWVKVAVLSSFCYSCSRALCSSVNGTKKKQNVLQGLQYATCMDFLDWGHVTNTVQVFIFV